MMAVRSKAEKIVAFVFLTAPLIAMSDVDGKKYIVMGNGVLNYDTGISKNFKTLKMEAASVLCSSPPPDGTSFFVVPSFLKFGAQKHVIALRSCRYDTT
jgi:hypothetical protein